MTQELFTEADSWSIFDNRFDQNLFLRFLLASKMKMAEIPITIANIIDAKLNQAITVPSSPPHASPPPFKRMAKFVK